MVGAGFEVRASRTGEGFAFAFRLDRDLADRAQAAAAGEYIELLDHAVTQASWEAVLAGGREHHLGGQCRRTYGEAGPALTLPRYNDLTTATR